jgi:glycosyltransferase involved in cell wall biosynthesis
MKICYINPTNNIRRPIAELSNLLAEKGHEITVMYPKSKECPTKNWVANDSVKNGNIRQLPIKSWYFAPLRYSFPNLIDLFKATKKIYKENDKIHIWEYYYPISVVPLLYAFLKGPQKQKKTTLTTDGFVGYSYKPKDPRWLVPAFKVYTNLIGRILFRIPGKMTTYGNPMIPYAKKAGVPMKKLKVLSTGIHLKKFENIDMNKVKKIQDEFKIKDEKVVLYAGMLTERKGIKKIIKISSKLLDEGYNIKTLLVGDAHGENIYDKLVRPEYKNKIIFTGGRKEIPEFMKLAEVFLLPSDGEGLPGVVMEAMAAGLPVVATNEGCTSDLIESGKEGFLVKLGDKGEGYYCAVKNILNDKRTAEMFKINAKKKIATFSWKDVGERYLQV